ncbi:DUF1609 domain-containing protein [Encephalitozoon hellem]|uniref:DUF1609 domain-containing protein n=1 Tax=Encephalitozoon hellem TaxID=27973 RepID=A0ABY8CLK1_ENCHE|nr:DUF1609 domain-containing protein [Encephalitozoon hellem]
MRLLVLETLILLDRIWSLPVENIGTVELKSSEKAVVFPLVFFGANAVVLPSTRFKDVKKGTDEESYIKGFMGCIADVVLSLTYYNAYCRDNVRLGAMFEREMRRHMKKVSEDALSVYVRGRNTFSEVLLMVYDRLFECNESNERRRMSVFGRCLIAEADDVMEKVSDAMDEESKDRMKSFCCIVRERGEKCCDIERWKQIVDAESIVCDASLSLYSKLPEEELLGLLAEGCMRKFLEKVELSKEEFNKRGYMEYSIVDTKLVLDTYDKHGCEVVEEIVRQMMMGMDGREIDSKYVEKVVRVVDERRRRRR